MSTAEIAVGLTEVVCWVSKRFHVGTESSLKDQIHTGAWKPFWQDTGWWLPRQMHVKRMWNSLGKDKQQHECNVTLSLKRHERSWTSISTAHIHLWMEGSFVQTKLKRQDFKSHKIKALSYQLLLICHNLHSALNVYNPTLCHPTFKMNKVSYT